MARGGLERTVIAGAVGAGLGVLVWLVVVAVTPSVVSGSACRQQAWGCLGDAIAGVGAAIAAVTVLAWPLLRLAGVRPAWAVALVALPAAFLVAHAYEAFTGSPAFALPGTILVPAVSCAAAAALTAPGARLPQTIGLAATGLPLLAAELPGYRIAQAGAENPGEWITYRLVPDSAPPELTPSVTYDQQVITVVISHAWPQFAPPAHCASDTGVSTTLADSPPCRPSGRGLWLRREGALIAIFTSYGRAVVELDADPLDIPVTTVERAAEHLVPSSASSFPSSP